MAEMEVEKDVLQNDLEDIQAQVEASINNLSNPEDGQLVEGTIVVVTNDYVFVDVGCKSEGRLSLSEFHDDPPKVGDTVTVLIVKQFGRGGPVIKKTRTEPKRLWRKAIGLKFGKDNCYYLNSTKSLMRFIYADVDKLKRFDIPDDSTTIRKYAFRGENTIERIIFPSGISVIEQSAFENCQELNLVEIKMQELELPKSTADMVIQKNAFKNCEKLNTVIFPENDNKLTIEKNVFENCESLRTIVLLGKGTFVINNEAFTRCKNDLLTFVVTSGSDAEHFARENDFEFIAT